MRLATATAAKISARETLVARWLQGRQYSRPSARVCDPSDQRIRSRYLTRPTWLGSVGLRAESEPPGTSEATDWPLLKGSVRPRWSWKIKGRRGSHWPSQGTLVVTRSPVSLPGKATRRCNGSFKTMMAADMKTCPLFFSVLTRIR